MSLRKIAPHELSEILLDHYRWLDSDGRTGKLADLSGADLHDVDLRRAGLQNVDLSGADLQGADLRETILYLANLQGANLRGTNLLGSDLRCADLRGAICDAGIQKSWDLKGSLWLRSDVPWWLGHNDQMYVVISDT